MALRVLHVDDDPLMRDAVELALLLDPNIAVTSCGSGEEAVAKAAKEPPARSRAAYERVLASGCASLPSSASVASFSSSISAGVRS